MRNYVRISTGVIVSLLIHLALLIGIMQQVKVRPPDVEGVIKVRLHLSLNQMSTPSGVHLVEAALAGASQPERALRTVKLKSNVPDKVTKVAEPIQTAALNSQISGHFRWRPPSTYQQSEVMNAMQLQQIAFQRQAQVTAVLNGLSAISAQLGPVITASMVCTQQANDDIDCVPEPKDHERSLIVQFFNMAIQARRLGIAENPVRMDFGKMPGISVVLR